MSRNPYLAATRPTSSFTRSSRSSKRNDLSTGRGLSGGGGLLGRSRSSVALSGGFSSHLSGASSYVPASSYTPSSSSTSSWQRSSSTTRPTSDSPRASARANDYVDSSRRQLSYEKDNATAAKTSTSLSRSPSMPGVDMRDTELNPPEVISDENVISCYFPLPFEFTFDPLADFLQQKHN